MKCIRVLLKFTAINSTGLIDQVRVGKLSRGWIFGEHIKV